MADAEANLYSTLTGFAGVQALVNNGDSPQTYRIYPMLMKQDDTLPAIVYQRIVGNRIVVMDDNSGSAPERIVFQITTWAVTSNAANDLMEQVRQAFAAATYEVVPLSNRSMFESDTRLFGMQYDFAMWHRN